MFWRSIAATSARGRLAVLGLGFAATAPVARGDPRAADGFLGGEQVGLDLSTVGEPQPLAFRPVLEGAAVSYIAEAPVGNQEPTTFELRARPPQASTITATVTRSFDTTSQ